MDDALDELIAIVELLRDAEFTQFRFQQGDFLVEISRGAPLASAETPAVGTPAQVPAAAVRAAPADLPSPAATAATSPALAEIDTTGAVTVESPMLGTFYGSPKPGEPPFVQVGDVVAPDTVLCIVEVMKLMNSVTAGLAGTVLEVAATDGQLVELGTPLFRISPAG
jgi:acetyl-CoA carboxylase biotin carboxyl carrier protein